MGERDYLYETTDRQAESKYPSWKDGESNLFTFLDAINKSQPIVQSQYEMVWSRWPRTRFFAKGFSVPGIAVATQEINHAGFTISIPTHVKYETTEVNFTIIADKEGYHYYDIRNMVLQSGHPLVAGDTRATIGNNFGLSPDEDTIEVWVRNHQEDSVGHHWVIHNFRPTKIGDIELSQDGSGFVEFEVTGTFTHITYDCGTKPEGISEPPSDEENQPQTDYGQETEEQEEPEEEEEEEEEGEEEEEEEWDEENEEEGGDEGENEQLENPFAEAAAMEEGEDIKDAEQTEQQNKDEAFTAQDEENLKDDDDRKADELVQQYGPNDPQLQAKMEEHIRQQNPDSDPEMIQTRAELALDNARDSAGKRGTWRQERKSSGQIKFSLAMCGDKGEIFGKSGKTIECEFVPRLVKVARDNHGITAQKAKIQTQPSFEFIQGVSNHAIAKSSLPRRFGMYKPSKSMKRFDSEIELDELNIVPKLDSAADPNHKFRSIF